MRNHDYCGMNIYRVNYKLKDLVGTQNEESTKLIIAEDMQKASAEVSSYGVLEYTITTIAEDIALVVLTED